MPAGNDSVQAARDLHAQYGVFTDASELIRHQAASIDPAVTRLGSTLVNDDATAELKGEAGWEDDVAKRLGLPEGSRVLDAAVRGNGLSVVYIDPLGAVRKAAGAANERYKEPELTVAERRAREEARHDDEVSLEVARLRAESDAKIEAAKAQIDAAAEAELAAFRAEKDERLREALEAEAADAEGVAAPHRPAAKPKAKEPKAKEAGS